MVIEYCKLDKQMLQFGLDNKQFTLSLQPIINTKKETFETLEVFIRWKHPVLGILPPSVFMPLMLKNGLNHLMTDYIIHEAINVCHFSSARDNVVGVNININLNELHRKETYHSLKGYIDNIEDPETICFEITPHIFLHYQNQVPQEKVDFDAPPSNTEIKYLSFIKQIFDQYSDLGITLALDTYEHILGAIDRAAFLGLHAIKISPKCLTKPDYLLKAVEKAQEHQIALIATSIENEQQMNILSQVGVIYAQGHFISPPAYVEHFNDTSKESLIYSQEQRVSNNMNEIKASQNKPSNVNHHIDQDTQEVLKKITSNRTSQFYRKII